MQPLVRFLLEGPVLEGLDGDSRSWLIKKIESVLGRAPSSMMMQVLVASIAVVIGAAVAATPAQWRARSIYQVLTDRFARPDGSTTASCDASARAYCGGTWRGIVDHLDYIQGMGFDAVRIWLPELLYQYEPLD